MKSVGTGLRAIKDAEDAGGKQFRTGLLPDEVTVTFNISAKGRFSYESNCGQRRAFWSFHITQGFGDRER